MAFKPRKRSASIYKARDNPPIISKPQALGIRQRHFVPHRQPHPPPFPRFAITPPLVLGFQNQRRHRARLLIRIQRHKRHIRRAGVPPFAGKNIFRENLHAHFHRSVEHAIDAGLQHHPFPHPDRKAKIQIIHRGRHHVADSRDGSPRALRQYQSNASRARRAYCRADSRRSAARSPRSPKWMRSPVFLGSEVPEAIAVTLAPGAVPATFLCRFVTLAGLRLSHSLRSIRALVENSNSMCALGLRTSSPL